MPVVDFLDGDVVAIATPDGDLSRIRTFGGAVEVTATVGGDFEQVELRAFAGAEILVYDWADPNGDPIGAIRYTTVTFEDTLSEVGSAQVVLDPSINDDSLWAQEHIWKISVEGVERFAFRCEGVIRKEVDSNQRETVEIVGRGVGSLLELAAIYPKMFGTAEQDVDRQFIDQSKGEIAETLLAEAQARGAIEHLTAYAWDGDSGSNGVTWPATLDEEFKAGGSLLDLYKRWAGDDFEWHVDSQLRIRLATLFGTDRSDKVVLYPAHTVGSAEVTTTRRDVRNVIVVQDGNEGASEIVDLDSIADYGRREQYMVVQEAIDEGTATAAGYPVLRAQKQEGVERRVTIIPEVQGRRPFVDFGLGDTVAVEFSDGKFPFRVLAIAYNGSQHGQLRAEVTLDYLLRSSTFDRFSSGGGGAGGGQKMVFAQNDVALSVVTQTNTCYIALVAFTSTYGKVGITIQCAPASTTVLTVNLMYGEDLVKSWQQQMTSGQPFVFGVAWLWTTIPQGEEVVRLSLSSSVGAITIAALGAQLWIEAPNIAGGNQDSPNVLYEEAVSYPVGPGELYLIDFQTPVEAEAIDVAEPYPTVAEETLALLILTIPIAADADDGWSDDQPSFVPDGDYVKAGDDGGDKAQVWLRFDLPFDLSGFTIHDAYLLGIADQTDSGVLLKVWGEDAAAATAPADRADLLSRSKTTASVDWDADFVFGVEEQSPDLGPIIEELLATHGASLTDVQILIEDDGSPTNAKMLLGSLEHATHLPPRLVIRYH